VIEVEVHSSLRAFLKEQGEPNWPHHLTMGRLVARALRLGRSALVQTETTVERYCLSYLTPALLSPYGVILVAPESVQQQLLQVEIPRLQEGLKTNKKVISGDRWPQENNFQGLLLTSPEIWLADQLEMKEHFPKDIPTIIDRADDLEEWARQQLTISIEQQDWDDLTAKYPDKAELIINLRVQLTQNIFNRPKNPYECYLLEEAEQNSLQSLLETLAREEILYQAFDKFWRRWQTDGEIIWATIDREKGLFTLKIAPGSVAQILSQVWERQPVVIIGSFLDWEANAPTYRKQIGLSDVLSLKFSPHRQSEHIHLYVPDRLPMPNTPQFQGVLMEQMRTLVAISSSVPKPIVLLVQDIPLKAQVAATIAAEFGSRVQVERTDLIENGILVSGWEFWRNKQNILPTPHLLAIATLPFPSVENPIVAGRVAYYKHQRQDWFRLYLLPAALREIQRAVVPLRESQGFVALLDNRVNLRSYGSIILSALEPFARINYLDSNWFRN
jgi:ATP-dependent DNA helicase DinG